MVRPAGEQQERGVFTGQALATVEEAACLREGVLGEHWPQLEVLQQLGPEPAAFQRGF